MPLVALARIGRALAGSCLAAIVLVAGCGGGGGGGGSSGGGGGGGGGEGALLSAPSALSYPTAPTLTAGTAMAPLAPTVTGSVSSYSVGAPLPAGLVIDANTGVISGTPTTATSSTAYVVTASNAAGLVNFNVTIAVVPTVKILSGASLARTVVAGTAIDADVKIVPVGRNLPDTVSAHVLDAAGIFLGPVNVTVNGDGTFTLGLVTASAALSGSYTGQAALTLCADAACATPLLPPFTVDVNITVINSASNWPGNHLTALAAWTGVPDWATFQGNAAHTGFVPVTLDLNAFSTRWQRAVVNAQVFNAQFNLATVTMSGSQFFLAGGNAIEARSEFDASLSWRYDFSGLQFPSANPPAVSGGTVYVAAGQQSSTSMFAFDAMTGTLVFRAPMAGQWENYLAPTVAAQGIYTNAGTYGGLYGLRPDGHQLFFNGAIDQQSVWTPAADATTVYAYTGARLTLVDPVTGTTKGTIVDPGFTNYIYVIGGSVVLGAPNSAFAAAYGNSFLNGGAIGNTLLHFDTKALTIDWQVKGVYPTTPAYADGVVYVANNSPLQLEARDESTGSLVWKWVPPASADSGFKSEVLLTNNLVFVSTNNNVYAIDRASHRQVWSYPVSANLALSRNGILYLEGVATLTAINVK